MKKLLSLMAIFVISLLTLSMVSALPLPVGNKLSDNLSIVSVKVNDEQIYDGHSTQKLAVEEGQKLSIRVGLQNNVNAKVSDIEVDAKISGYQESSNYDSLTDSTTLFDINTGVTKYVNLEVSLPNDLKNDEDYSLRVRVTDQNSDPLTIDVPLQFEAKRHGVDIADVVFAPSTSIKAGRSLLTTVLLENFGDKTEKDVKVTVAIPELSISASEYVDSLTANNVEYEDVPEMFLPIPANAVAGVYQVKVTVDYNNLKDTISNTYPITVLANEAFQTASDKLVLAVGPETQPVAVGKTATYGVALTNAGSTSKAYLIEAVAGDWAAVSMSDSLVVVEKGQSKVVYVEVTPNADATAGEHVFSLSVKSGNDVLQTVTLKANVLASQKAAEQTFNLRNGLEIALIILVVLLVIIGLIIGFSRLKKDEDDKTYY